MKDKIFRKITAFFDYWKTRKFIGFVLLFLLLTYLAQIPTLIIMGLAPDSVESLTSPGVKALQEGNLFYVIARLVILVPIFETFFLQYLPIILINKFSKNKYLQVAISAILFGLSHPYSVVYIIFATFVGVVFATGFILRKESRTTGEAFWATALTHGLANMVSVLAIFTDL